ncbi:DNA-processing protein DprA [Helicobacter burdigaliensis]|uniref:DNA-processing protein DprA n=1 Tax=Helicobacter burdigaliensis TaxID=2315334 RepID=UPI000EF72993|nr:DNA-processing protein DprA [Helicobacter burdigaliensis]
MQECDNIPKELENLGLKKLYYKGNLELLEKRKVTILGTRRPSPYAQSFTQEIASKLSSLGVVVVSGGALGIDIIAHNSAYPNTIMISPSSLDIIYPKYNQKSIQKIYEGALALSQFESPYKPREYSFLERNKLVVSFGECVIIPEADLQSGSSNSAAYALKIGKKIFAPPHRIQESKATNGLLSRGEAEAIYDIDEFLEKYFKKPKIQENTTDKKEKDTILEFCKTNPLFEEALKECGDILYEYELEGKIERKNGRVYVVWKT